MQDLNPPTIPPDAVRVGPLPTYFETALGYCAPENDLSRWLITYWIPGGDEVYYQTGASGATGQYIAYQHLVDVLLRTEILHGLHTLGVSRWSLGSSDDEATHCLLCDLEERQVYVIELKSAQSFLRTQCPSPQSLVRLNREDLVALTLLMRPPSWETVTVLCMVCSCTGFLCHASGFEPCPNCDAQGSWKVGVNELEALRHEGRRLYLINNGHPLLLAGE